MKKWVLSQHQLRVSASNKQTKQISKANVSKTNKATTIVASCGVLVSLKKIAPQKVFWSSVCWSHILLKTRKSLVFSQSLAHSIKTKHLCTKRHSEKPWHETTFTFFLFFLQNSFICCFLTKKSPSWFKNCSVYSISVLYFCKLCKFCSRTSGVWARSGQFGSLQKR